MAHGQWSPCYDLLTDWVKKYLMEWDKKADCSEQLHHHLRRLVKQTSVSNAINDDSLQGIYKLTKRRVIIKTRNANQ